MTTYNIIVCIKPVPDPARWNHLRLDPETMLLKRDEVPPVINPLDKNAIEQALQLKQQFGGKISVISMAPPDGVEQLEEALALGCDDAYLLTDSAFAGADTLATARTLHAAINKIGLPDLVFCGGYSLDGSTAQVGPQLAAMLSIPDLTHAIHIDMKESSLQVHSKREQGVAIYEANLPVLITFDKEANEPRLANMVGIRKASRKVITNWSADDLGLKNEQVGLAGSPTRMLNIFKQPVRKKAILFTGNAEEAVDTALNKLLQDKIILIGGQEND